MKNKSIFKKYGYIWITLIFFIGSIILHWFFAWQAFVNEKSAQGEQPQFSTFAPEVLRDTFENWQSEFLQLIWQVAGLAFLLYVGSPSSKEGDERKEEKLDEIIKLLDTKKGDETIKKIDKKYFK